MKLIHYWSIGLPVFLLWSIHVESIKETLNDLLALECDQPLVTLHIFSSRPNPIWKINKTQTNNIKTSAINNIKSYNNLTFDIKPTKRVMGYNGFSINCPNSDEIIVNGLSFIERRLLETGRPYLSETVINHVKNYIGQTMITNSYRNLLRINCDNVPIKGPDTVPVFNPQTDNGGCFITKQTRNNCYAYAADIVTNTFPQPGRYSGRMPSSITCEGVKNASVRDGFVYKGMVLPTSQPKYGHYVALFLWSNRDYHWIRKDANGFWSHKPGPAAVTNKDNTGSFIANPVKSNFAPWTIFCGYYIAQPSKVHIN